MPISLQNLGESLDVSANLAKAGATLRKMERLPLTVFHHVPVDCKSITLVITDNFDPTQELAFLRPFRNGAALRETGIVFLSQNDLIRLFTFNNKRNYHRIIERSLHNIRINAIIFSRYTGSFLEDFLEMAQARNIPTAAFLDDNLLEVPMEIGESAYIMYHQHDRAKALRTTLAEVDLVIASTKALCNQLTIYAHKKMTYTKIYCSTGPEELRPLRLIDRPKRIGYMASIWHKHDLEFVSDQIFAVLEKHKDIEFQVFGFDFTPESKFKIKHKSFKPVSASYMAFRNFHDTLGWDVGIAPLRPLGYNRCKANTKWVEYSCAGSAVIAAEMDPYWDLGRDAVTLSKADGWADALTRIIEDKEYRHSQQQAAQDLLMAQYNFDAHAQQFCDIMLSINVEI